MSGETIGEVLLKLVVEHGFDRTRFDPEGWRVLSKTVSLVNRALNRWLNVNSLRAAMLGELKAYNDAEQLFYMVYIEPVSHEHYCYRYKWFKNGKMEYKMHFQHHKPFNHNGTLEVWHKNGNLWKQSTYVYGNLDGPYIECHENGKIALECTYKMGVLHGECKRYSKKRGKLIERSYYENDKRVYRDKL